MPGDGKSLQELEELVMQMARLVTAAIRDKGVGGLSITLADNGDTLLTGLVADQAALHGLLKKVRDLGLPLVSVNPVGPGPSTPSPFGDLSGQTKQIR